MKSRTLVVGVIVASVVGVFVVACGGGGGDNSMEISKGTAILNTTVVNTRDGSLTPGVNVVVDGGRITTITGTPIRLSGTAQAIDASGKYVVPGFLDMHTHASATLANPPSDFPVLLANGITGIREASGSPALIQAIKQQNANVVAGTVDAPEVLIMPSTIFGGQATTAAAAVQFVKDRKAEGADYLKLTAGNQTAVTAILGEVANEGFYVAGHLVTSISALDSSNAGWRSMEHLGAGWGLILDCSTDQANIRQDALANPAPPAPNVINPRVYDGNFNALRYQRIIDTYSDAQCQSLAQTFVKNGTWQPATLIRLRTQDYGDYHCDDACHLAELLRPAT